ncbi:MAG: ion transporter [Patescibacteria group bacterium]
MSHHLRTRTISLVENQRFERLVIGVILLNSIVLGLETYPTLYDTHQVTFRLIDTLFLAFFIVEIALRLYAYRWSFFRGGWNCFDFAIVAISLLPFLGNLSALRALRILRALRLLSAVQEFREIIESLLRAARGAAAVFGILGLLLYVSAVLSSKLFGAIEPELFGNLERSLFTHVHLMVFDNWSSVANQLIDSVGFWTFWYLLAYSLVVGFVLISLLIGVIVEAKQTVTNAELYREIRQLRAEIRGQQGPHPDEANPR